MVLFLLVIFWQSISIGQLFDSEIVRSLSAYFGKTRSEIGYWHFGYSKNFTKSDLILNYQENKPSNGGINIYLNYKMKS